jgi:hypothetical protein
MRLIHTSLAVAATLGVTATAFAAGSHDEVVATMGGTARLQSGGQLRLIATRKTAKSKNFKIVIRYDVTVRAGKTVLAFAVHPCKSTTCTHFSTSTIELAGPRLRHVTFTGHVPVNVRDDGTACVYAQLRDQGPKGKAPGKIVHKSNGRKGVTLCRKV